MQVTEQRVTLPGKGTLLGKRIFDLTCSALGLVICSPLFLLVALGILLTSPGGVLFRQERVGRGGKPFTIYKFRTMRIDNGGLKITTSNDRRITAIGRVLRKTKLDELPQLLNVLKGDMSLVGPRPEVAEYTRLYTPEQQQVLLVRPGITGVASVCYRNENELLSESDDPNRTYIEEIMPEKLRLDLTYLPKASVCYDVVLIVRTIGAVLTR